ncbi:ABC transporter ATP-binding protein [Ferruginivarius sediminum]|uniref:ABC transporter ATP-binding protein n=1 Tax=Ferruginivarius sediminum TaxID=2661937 RepID=A0A369TF53_9PROT|nr:ABC transporter ATP-binding protein [Ferruginivarius sediminum]RDD63880.1 ABC transporter ATP-binding protein [Ferruginivarius sediminum]
MEHYGKAPAVRIQGARLAYGGHLLFDKLNLEIPAARTTCLLGPSGVGKTSLLRLVAGLAADSEGTVADAAGRPLDGRIAYMAQQDLLLPWLSALDNVLIGSRLRGETVGEAERRRAHDLLVRVGLGGRTDARPAALSGGMRQRVALARTLMEDRPVVLMDEPFSGLDAITRYELQALAAEVLTGRTVLVVTHDPLEALRLGHRLLVLAGRPAVLDDSVQPPDDAPPRDAARQDVLALQARLLDRLSLALEATR